MIKYTIEDLIKMDVFDMGNVIASLTDEERQQILDSIPQNIQEKLNRIKFIQLQLDQNLPHYKWKR